MAKNTAVIGLGNRLISDEGIGVHLVRILKERQPAGLCEEQFPEVDFIDAGTGGMSILHIIAGRDKVVFIDSAKMGHSPGTIKRFLPAQAESVKKMTHLSLHETDLLQIIEMSKRLGQRPEQIVIFGIEPEKVEPGEKLSNTLSRNISEYIALISKDLP